MAPVHLGPRVSEVERNLVRFESQRRTHSTLFARFSNLKAEAETSDYPVGSLPWAIQDRNRNASFNKLLSLTACSGKPLCCNSTTSSFAEFEFTCDSGLCVPMVHRCDQNFDCNDMSDEADCRLVHVNPKQYQKVRHLVDSSNFCLGQAAARSEKWHFVLNHCQHRDHEDSQHQ